MGSSQLICKNKANSSEIELSTPYLGNLSLCMFIEIGRPPEIFHQEILRRSLVVDPHNYQIHCFFDGRIVNPIVLLKHLKT